MAEQVGFSELTWSILAGVLDWCQCTNASQEVKNLLYDSIVLRLDGLGQIVFKAEF